MKVLMLIYHFLVTLEVMLVLSFEDILKELRKKSKISSGIEEKQ